MEPKSYTQAVKDSKWREAMVVEIEVLGANSTWSLTPLPSHKKKPIGCKWVYNIKHKSDSSIERFKVRLVAKWFTQKKSYDYIETFSLVAEIVSIKCLLGF